MNITSNSLYKRFRICLVYLLLWMVYFSISRIVFLIYYSELFDALGFSTHSQTLIYGLKLDLSMSAYIALLPFVFMSFSVWVSTKFVKLLIYSYTLLVFFVIHTLMFFDLGLYGAWGIRLDAMFLSFSSTPKSMFASVSTSVLIFSILIWVFSIVLYSYFFRKIMKPLFKKLTKGRHWHFLLLLLATGSLIVAMRGGLQTIPINQSDVYFSDHMIANHAAENFAWSFAKSASYNVHNGENPFIKMEMAVAKELVGEANRQIAPTDTSSNSINLLSNKKPNVIIILWESLTAKVVESLGGEKGVTENLDRLTKEGILFDSIYANGSRSDKGIVALLSGYYPQPGQSIMKMPTKSRSLPSLPRSMSQLGYNTSFYYGGDLNFGNMVSYLRHMNVDYMVSEDDFKHAEKNSKWGAHDHVLFNRYLDDKKVRFEEPFFDVIFTLSSHEPFEFPDEYKFGDRNDIERFKSAHAYTDKTVGAFIQSAKKQDWWDSTLVIIIADHGHQLPRQAGSHVAPSRFHIPMVWLGGAVAKKDTIISTIGSQIDLSYTLLSLLGGDNNKFTWSQDLLNPSKDSYAHYIFTNGFGTVNSNGCTVYDYTAKKNIYTSGKNPNKLEQLGSAITQLAYQDFLERK